MFVGPTLSGAKGRARQPIRAGKGQERPRRFDGSAWRLVRNAKNQEHLVECFEDRLENTGRWEKNKQIKKQWPPSKLLINPSGRPLQWACRRSNISASRASLHGLASRLSAGRWLGVKETTEARPSRGTIDSTRRMGLSPRASKEHRWIQKPAVPPFFGGESQGPRFRGLQAEGKPRCAGRLKIFFLDRDFRAAGTPPRRTRQSTSRARRDAIISLGGGSGIRHSPGKGINERCP